jgi:hypothetical protein
MALGFLFMEQRNVAMSCSARSALSNDHEDERDSVTNTE